MALANQISFEWILNLASTLFGGFKKKKKKKEKPFNISLNFHLQINSPNSPVKLGLSDSLVTSFV